ncbi:MAG: hypothetical protein R3F35_22515 [Myxococcota bacterium]
MQQGIRSRSRGLRRLRPTPATTRLRRLGFVLLASIAIAAPVSSARADEARWEDYLDHAYVYSAADIDDLRGLIARAETTVGTRLADHLAETLARRAARGESLSELELRRKAIAELLLYRSGQLANGLELAAATIENLSDRLDRHENRYWFHTIHAHRALAAGDASAFVDEILSLWLAVITPLEVPFETYRTLALTENGNAGFVRTLPHLYESIARLVLVHSQSEALDGDIDPLAAIVRVLADDRVGADPETVPLDASSKDFLDHLVARLDGPESDGGSLSYTLALVSAERAHQLARTRLAEDGFSVAALAAIRDSVAAYQRAMRAANTLQGQVAIYARALRQQSEVFATAERAGRSIDIDIPFSIDRGLELYEALHAGQGGGWERLGYLDQGRDAYVAAMQGLWSEIQDATFNAARYYMSVENAEGRIDDESIVHAINHYSRYLHAYQRFAGDPSGESLPDAATFGAYQAARGIGDGVLFFSGGDAAPEQLREAIAQYETALAYFPFDRALWSTLAVALQRSGREADFLGVAQPIANRVVHSRHLDRWIGGAGAEADVLEKFRRAFANDRSLVYFGFADETKVGALEQELARLSAERAEIARTIAATRDERDQLALRRREAMRQAAEASGENRLPAPPRVAAGRSVESFAIEKLASELDRLDSRSERLDVRLEAIEQALPIFKATLGHEDLIAELAMRRDHPVHALLRRLADEVGAGAAPVASASTGLGNVNAPGADRRAAAGGNPR